MRFHIAFHPHDQDYTHIYSHPQNVRTRGGAHGGLTGGAGGGAGGERDDRIRVPGVRKQVNERAKPAGDV